MAPGEHLLEAVDDLDFRSGEPLPIDVRAVGQQRQDPGGSELREPVKIDVLAVERRLVDLEVPRVDHDAARRLDRDRHAVRDAVRHAQELDRERSDLHPIARTHSGQPGFPGLVVLVELVLDEGERQRRSEHRAVEVRQHVPHGADVIFVAVGQHERRELVLLELAEIRDDQIHAEQLRLREHHARIDEDGRVAARDDHHVHPEFADAAERDQLERRNVRRDS